MGSSKIEWTDSTWNPVTGCTKISPGCEHCYAERMAIRLKAMGQRNYRNGFGLTLHEGGLGAPLKWVRPRTVFVNSMSDLFHAAVPFAFIERVFDVMRRGSQHQFQILTKRSRRLAEISDRIVWPRNVWMGVSVENAEYGFRIGHLRSCEAAIKFISFEPLLGPVGRLDLSGIDWVIVGGESGPRARRMDADWVRDIREQCLGCGVPFFFKQWGGVNKKKWGRVLDGRTWDELPVRAGVSA